ncbi:MAG: sulfatase [Myxococcota bacterium]
MRFIRLAALAIGYVTLTVIAAAFLAVGLRALWVAWIYDVPEPEHLSEKEAYLASLPQVDPAHAPNFVVIFFDDLGYGDLSSYGNALIETPHIDRAAAEGIRFTEFYSASPVCTPSRASLLTGRYPPRAGVPAHVYFPNDSRLGWLREMAGLGNELPRDEALLPEVLGAAGYATGMVGKWHLGGRDGHRPTERGFDEWLGVLWSNDMYPLDLWRDDEIAERDERESSGWGEHDEEQPLPGKGIDQSRLTERYTEAAIDFIDRNAEAPFFLYVAHTFPHVPHYPSSAHAGESQGGVYGDVIEDLDRSTGAILEALRERDLERETFVLITSDNGGDYNGSVAGLRGRKQEIFEGGQRVPAVGWWPGRIKAGRETRAMAMNIDVFPTLLGYAGLPLPKDRSIDGADLGPLLAGEQDSPHEFLFYFPATSMDGLPEAVRDADFKYLRSTGVPMRDRPHLSDLSRDKEAHDLRKRHPERAEALAQALEAKRTEFENDRRGWR